MKKFVDQYERAYNRLLEEQPVLAHKIRDYIYTFCRRRYDINEEIGTYEVYKHCEMCLDTSIPYEAFIGAVELFDRWLIGIDGNFYWGLSNNSPLMRIKHGRPVNRRKYSEGWRMIQLYGEKALDPNFFKTIEVVPLDMNNW